MKEYSNYFRAKVRKETTWFVVGCFRNEDHVAFERTLEGQSDILEFFVPKGQETFFIEMMGSLQRQGYVYSIEKEPNRFITE